MVILLIFTLVNTNISYDVSKIQEMKCRTIEECETELSKIPLTFNLSPIDLINFSSSSYSVKTKILANVDCKYVHDHLAQEFKKNNEAYTCVATGMNTKSITLLKNKN